MLNDQAAEPPKKTSGEKTLSPSEPQKREQHASNAYSQLVAGLKQYFKSNGFQKAVVGVSGGVDSALTLKIAVDALGSDYVTALVMPELGVSKQVNIDHAKALCVFLGVRTYYQPINVFLMDYKALPWYPNKS
jgi:NH3-dependent NAD+ synthetase